MKPYTPRSTAFSVPAALILAGILWMPARSTAQTAPPAAAPHAHTQATAPAAPAGSDQELQKQLAELRAQVAKLQAALDQQQKQAPQMPMAAPTATPTPAPGRRMMGEMGGMQKDKMAGMGSGGGMGAGQAAGMSGGGMGMMDMDMMEMDMHKGEMGMPPEEMMMPEGMMMNEMGMGGMSGGAGASASGGMTMGGGGANAAPSGMRPMPAPRSMSSLPGVPGASHVYHIGSTGFFLDQPQLNLTTQQQTALNRIKERALLDRANAERRIEQAEQELWALTGADQPDAAKVQAKLQEIEQLRTNQRIAFIRAVGEGAKLLTAEQQNALLGNATPTK